MALDGSDLTRLTTNPAADLDPTAAQGFVFFSSYRDGNANLYRLPLFGGTQTRLTTNSANQLEPFVNPEGSRLVFTDDRTGFPKVWSSKVTPATGAIFSTILRTGIDGTAASIEASPTFRPGTLNQIAYVTTELASADIFRKQFPNPATPLINGSAADVEPMYNPAGNQIAFTSNRHGNPEIYLYDIGSGVTTRLTNNAEYDGQPTFLPDGRIVYVGEVGGNRRLKWINPTTMAGGTIITGGVPRNPSYVPLY